MKPLLTVALSLALAAPAAVPAHGQSQPGTGSPRDSRGRFADNEMRRLADEARWEHRRRVAAAEAANREADQARRRRLLGRLEALIAGDQCRAAESLAARAGDRVIVAAIEEACADE